MTTASQTTIKELMASGKIKRAPPHVVAHWVLFAWTSNTAELVAKSFKKCCISNALDGMENDLLWDDEDNCDVDDPSSNDAGQDEDSI